MKYIVLLSFTFCLLSSLQAQNPYVELSKPWLNLQKTKEKKVSSMLLATMSADNSTLEKQVKLTFNSLGQLVTEECKIGFRYTETLDYDASGHLSKYFFRDETSADTVDYVYNAEQNKYYRLTKKKTAFGTWEVKETVYAYNELGKLISIGEYEGIVPNVGAAGKNELSLKSEIQVIWNDNAMIIKGPETLQTLTYDNFGVLQSWKTENFTYGMSETYQYSYDQNGRLVMIVWEQEGNSNKTFVTYEF